MNIQWNKPITYLIGGLTEIGFYDKWNYLLVVSHQGRSVFDCYDITKVARDKHPLQDVDWNRSEKTIKGIGPLANKNIHCVGIWGGNLAQSTKDGWLVEILKDETVLVKSPDDELIQFQRPITELRAVGFSNNGKTFIYASSSEIIFYSKRNDRNKKIMSCLPLLEKSYKKPRKHDDNFMHDVVLLACNWGRPGWLNLALNWLDDGFKIDRTIINVLEKLLQLDNLPQKINHRVYATIKRWKIEFYIYIDVIWIHEINNEPIRLVSELDEERFETRKLEYFMNGSVNYADEDNITADTRLGTIEVPPLSEINSDKQFVGKEISKIEFDALWFKRMSEINNVK